MAGTVLHLDNVLEKDDIGEQIANYWVSWNTMRASKVAEWEEVRRYVFATDTRKTTNSKLPWKNSTTVPKLCQIRDNLYSNYLASLFPKRKWLIWEANEQDSNSRAKRDAILNYMNWVISQERFRREVEKLVLDYIDCGNAFATVEWVDERQMYMPGAPTSNKYGYVGPAIQRISPFDIVFNPTASSFLNTPKIIRSLLSIGEVKKLMESLETAENRRFYEDLWDYMLRIRATVRNSPGDVQVKDSFYQVDGFTSYRSYLESDYVEVLTFYGDLFSTRDNTLRRNHKIMVVDRHKVLHDAPNPTYFGYPPIFHIGWRVRQDNLWAMGPLDNLVGMQYRIDHIENLKADTFDLLTLPPLKIKGHVEDFTWGPMTRIHVGEEGDVEMMAPPVQILQANIEIQALMAMMEEMAGSPKEAMGFRTPGEKTKYEVQRLENAASRIFINKIHQFSDLIEQCLNAMLELARRNMATVQQITVFDDEFKIQVFETIAPSDIVGAGRIRPVAAKHFAERAEMVQNLTAFANSAIGQDSSINVHISGLAVARLFEDLLELQDYGVVSPYVRLAEQADAQRRLNAHQEAIAMEAQTPTGLTPDDYDVAAVGPTPGGTEAV